MTQEITFHQDRAILEISGDDRKKFLQGLITNDVNKANEKNIIYACMLNNQGRFLYDFFIFESGEKLVLDCFKPRRDEILKKLSFYKLRSKVEIKKNDELVAGQCFNAEFSANFIFPDPRHKALGHRIYQLTNQFSSNTDHYNFVRIANKIPESEHDLTYEKSFIQEFGFDDLNAIDYNKGCYVGQEFTARTHYRGEIRKKIFYLKFPNQKPPVKGQKILLGNEEVGEILSSIFYKNELHALALIKVSDSLELDKIKLVIDQ